MRIVDAEREARRQRHRESDVARVARQRQRPLAEREHLFFDIEGSACLNCGVAGRHFVPPSFGESGFFICEGRLNAQV